MRAAHADLEAVPTFTTGKGETKIWGAGITMKHERDLDMAEDVYQLGLFLMHVLNKTKGSNCAASSSSHLGSAWQLAMAACHHDARSRLTAKRVSFLNCTQS